MDEARSRALGTTLVTALLASAAVAGVVHPAVGQVPPPARDTAAPAADTLPVLPLRGIVVRALRTPADLGTLPFSVTIRRPSELPPTAGLGLGAVLRAVPGLQVHDRHNDALGDRIVMRGFGARSQFGVRGVHVLVDGVPATMPDGQTTLNHLDLAGLTRAEILRGPAAAAYGNSAGGVLVLSLTPPPAAEWLGEAGAMAGSDGLVRARGSVGGTTGALGWRATVAREWRDGYRPHAGTDRSQFTGRFDAPLAGGRARIVAHGVLYDADNPGALTPDQFEEDPSQAQAFNVAQRTGEDGRHGQVGLAWERVIGSTLLETTAYGLVRSLDNPIPPTIIELDRTAGGGRVLVRGGAWDGEGGGWALGLDAALQADDRKNYDNESGARGALTLDQSERVTNVAIHGQAVLPLHRRIGLLLAARYDRIGFAAEDWLIEVGNPDDSGDRTMNAFSPTAGLRIDVAPGVMAFANLSTAFETPTTTELVNRPDGAGGFNPSLEPQRTVSYEIGGRAAVPVGLGAEFSVYEARIEDALVAFEVESAPGRQYFRNAAGAVHRGVELLVELRRERWDVRVSYDRTLAEFTSYTAEDRSFDGLTVPGVRPWTLDGGLVVRPAPVLAMELDYRAVGDMVVDDANETRAPGHHLFSLRASAQWAAASGLRLHFHAGVENVFDETYVASVVPNAFGRRYLEPGPGRALYVGIEVGSSAQP